MFKRLRSRLTATYIALLVLSMLILGGVLLYSLKNYYYSNLEKRLETQAFLSSELIGAQSADLNPNLLQAAVEDISRETGARVTVIAHDGTVLGDSERNAAEMENHSSRPEVRESLAGNVGQSVRHSDTLGIDMMYVAVPLAISNQDVGAVRLALPVTETKQAFQKLWSAVVLAILLALMITVPISLALGKRLTTPVEKLIEFAGRISRGDFSEPVDIGTKNGEIGDLAASLNQMASALEEKVLVISEQHTRLATVLDNLSSGVIFVNRQGDIDLVNPAAGKFLSFEPEDSVGFHYQTVIKYQELGSKIGRALREKEILRDELAIVHPQETFLEAVVSPIFDQSGEFSGVVAVLHDITQIRKLEKMRRDFAANVSHELRTPITAIKGFTETLLDGALYDQSTCEEFIQIIDREAERLGRLVQDLLDLSRIETKEIELKMKRTDLRSVVTRSVDKMRPEAEKAGHTLDVQLADEEIPVKVDEDLIGQVLVNLIDNAISYTPQGGRIEVEAHRRGHDAVVWVRDNGLGIPQKDLERIFERFYRVDKTRSRKKGGTGLGLSIVKHIVDIHGGSVGVDSTPGKGSAFFFTLPKA